MSQLSLNFTDIPIPETCLWEQIEDQQKRIVIETLARLLVEATRTQEQSNDWSFQNQTFAHTACRLRLRSPIHARPSRAQPRIHRAPVRLADKACQLGWPKEQVKIIDEDLGLSGSSTDKRSGFAHLTSEVALAHVGIMLGLEVSRLARNNADWYRLQEFVRCH